MPNLLEFLPAYLVTVDYSWCYQLFAGLRHPSPAVHCPIHILTFFRTVNVSSCIAAYGAACACVCVWFRLCNRSPLRCCELLLGFRRYTFTKTPSVLLIVSHFRSLLVLFILELVSVCSLNVVLIVYFECFICLANAVSRVACLNTVTLW